MTPQEKADIALLEQDQTYKDLLRTLPLERRTKAVCSHAVQMSGANIRYVPRALLSRSLCLRAIRDWAFAFDYVPEELKTEAMCREAVRHYGSALNFVPDKYRTASLCMLAVRHDPWALTFVPDKVLTAQMCETAVKGDGLVLKYVPKALRTPELCREALNAEPFTREMLRSVLEDIPFPEVCLEGLQKYHRQGYNLMELMAGIDPSALTEQVALYGVQTDPMCLLVLPAHLRSEKICLEAVRGDGILLHDIPEAQRSAALCEAAVMNSAGALLYVPDKLHTRDLYRKALAADPAAIRYFKPQLLTREDCEMAYTRSKGWDIVRFIPYPDLLERMLDEHCDSYSKTQNFLKNVNPEVMTMRLAEKIFLKEPELFYALPERLRDRSLCEAAVKIDGMNLRYVPEALKTEDLCRSAVKASPYAIEYLPETMKNEAFYASMIEEKPRILRGVPEAERTEALNRLAFERSYLRDSSDYSALGAITRPELLMQVLHEEQDPQKIDLLLNLIPRRMVSEEMAYEAIQKNSRCLHLLAPEIISKRIAERAVREDPQAIQWVPQHLRTPEMCLYAESNYLHLRIYVPESVAKGDNIYSFHRRVDQTLRQPLDYAQYKILYTGGSVVVDDVTTRAGYVGCCRVTYDRKKDEFSFQQLTRQQEQTYRAVRMRKTQRKMKL